MRLQKTQGTSFHFIISYHSAMKQNMSFITVESWQQGETGCCVAEGWREVTFPVEQVVKPSSEAVPLHEAVRLKQRNKPPVKGCISVWMGGLFRRGMLTAECQGRRAERSYIEPSLSTPCHNKQTSLALPVRLASWSRNKYTATIKIHSLPSVVLASLALVVVQPHTTKSLTGGVLSTCVSAWGC